MALAGGIDGLKQRLLVGQLVGVMRLPGLEVITQGRFGLQQLQRGILKHVVREGFLLLQDAVEKPPTKKAVMRLRLQRFHCITRVGLIQSHQHIPGTRLHGHRMAAQPQLIVKQMTLVGLGTGHHLVDVIGQAMHDLV